MYCGFTEMTNDDFPENHDEIDMKVAQSGTLKQINELDPEKQKLTLDDLENFFKHFDHTYSKNREPKQTDYLVIDNFLEFFVLNEF